MTRQLVPPLFVSSLVATAVLGIWVPGAWEAFAGIAGAYVALLLTGAALAVRKHGFRCSAVLAAVFSIMHVCYGVGYLRGILDHWSPFRRRVRRTTPMPLTR